MIYFVDDDPVSFRLIAHGLAQFPIPHKGFESAEALLETTDHEIDLVLLDLNLGGLDGMTCLTRLRERQPDLPIIIVSSDTLESSVSEAFSRGAMWYVTKPFGPQEIRRAVENALITRPLKVHARPETDSGQAFQTQTLERIANSERSLLILGENGTGKTALAKRVHSMGKRAEKPFIAISCAGIPEDLFEAELFGSEKGAFTGANSTKLGLVELAEGGTLFLDEIGELPYSIQPKLLTFLQDRTSNRIGSRVFRSFDVRIISATNQNLEEKVSRGEFREDLFYRINALSIKVPALRERKSELLLIAEQILQRVNQREGGLPKFLSVSSQTLLQDYAFPGNIRELENMVERAHLYCDGTAIEPNHFSVGGLAAKVEKSITSVVHLAELEIQTISAALQRNNGNRARSARELGITERTLYNKIRRCQL